LRPIFTCKAKLMHIPYQARHATARSCFGRVLGLDLLYTWPPAARNSTDCSLEVSLSLCEVRRCGIERWQCIEPSILREPFTRAILTLVP
jgi:hypothetical protein